jgi:hypothetical protein
LCGDNFPLAYGLAGHSTFNNNTYMHNVECLLPFETNQAMGSSPRLVETTSQGTNNNGNFADRLGGPPQEN